MKRNWLRVFGGRVNLWSGWTLVSEATGSCPGIWKPGSLVLRPLEAVSCGLWSPGQQVVRATWNRCLIFCTTVLLCIAFSPIARAQTNSPDASIPATNAPADSSAATNAPTAPLLTTNTPADSAPAVPVAPLINNAVNAAQAQPTGPDPGLEDIRPPIFFLHSWFWFWVIVAAIIAVALIAFIVWYFLRPHRQLTAKSAYELALEKLEKARALLQEDNPMPYAVFVSETIRSYLGQRFQTPSTRRTTEEFLQQMEADPNTPLAEHRDLLRTFLQSCDLVKFARYQPTSTELEQVQGRALTFVTATKPLPDAAQQNGRHTR